MIRQRRMAAMRVGLAIGVSIMVFASHAPSALARPAAFDLSTLMIKAMTGVHSFMVVTDSASKPAPTSPGGVMRMHITEIVVHRSSGFTLSINTTLDGVTSSEVYTGTHVCLKRTATVAWNCTVPPSYAKTLLANLDPVKAFKASGTIMTSTGSPSTKSIQGQPCIGYSFAMSMSSLHLAGHGTMWFSQASGRLTRIDDTSTMALVAGSPPMVSTGASTYSRWDDATLRLPPVPAS